MIQVIIIIMIIVVVAAVVVVVVWLHRNPRLVVAGLVVSGLKEI